MMENVDRKKRKDRKKEKKKKEKKKHKSKVRERETQRECARERESVCVRKAARASERERLRTLLSKAINLCCAVLWRVAAAFS